MRGKTLNGQSTDGVLTVSCQTGEVYTGELTVVDRFEMAFKDKTYNVKNKQLLINGKYI